MAAAAVTAANSLANFDSWLTAKLQELKTDEGVFGSYIRGILEGDETDDEKTEALEGILTGITEDSIGKHVTEILEAWAKWGHVEDVAADDTPKEDVDVRLARMLESQSLATTTHKSNFTAEERRIKEAILAQYSQMSDQGESDDEDDDDGHPGGGGGAGTGGGGSGANAEGGLEKNTNVANIIQAEKEKRERFKQESLKKKEKDKEDREKQKQLKEEKKEKRKTQKGERRR